jgi:hypothetical protein
MSSVEPEHRPIALAQIGRFPEKVKRLDKESSV